MPAITTQVPTPFPIEPIVIENVTAGDHEQFTITVARDGLTLDTIELHRREFAHVIATSMVYAHEYPFVGYVLPDQPLTKDEVFFTNKNLQISHCNNFCSLFVYFRYHEKSRLCKCNDWLDVSQLKDHLLRNEINDEFKYDKLYRVQPSLDHWMFTNFSNIVNDEAFPSFITLRNISIYHPRVLQQKYRDLRCHSVIISHITPFTGVLYLRCRLPTCFAIAFLMRMEKNGNVTLSSFTLDVLELISNKREIIKSEIFTENLQLRFNEDLSVAQAAIDMHIDVVDECSAKTLKVSVSNVEWDAYTAQNGVLLLFHFFFCSK